jgi:lipopolysaccharide export system protein LptC
MALTADQIKRLERLKQRHSPSASHRHYSRFVRVMKILLPSLAAVLLALVVVWPRLRFDDTRFRIGFAKLSPQSVQTLAMQNARYLGLDENNQPYSVTSDRATQEEAQPDIIDLDQPKADFTSKDGSAIFVQADRGYYHQKAQVLDLVGTVNLYHEKGYELHTERAEVNLADSSAHGEVPVNGQGTQGLLQGEGFQIRNKGSEVLVTGKSELTLKAVGGPARQGRKK